MSPELEQLIQLQQLESAIAEARARITAYPQRLAEADARLAEADSVVQEATQRLKDAQKARGDSEKDAAVFQGRLTKFKDQLSAVKTNREYTAMQHEIETAQKDLGAAEEKVLERMMEIDQLTADLKQAETAKAAQKKTVDAEKATLASELAADEKRLTEKTAGRAALVASLAPRLIALFEQVAKVRKGVALSMATRDGLCSICHVRMRPQVFQQVRQNDSVVQCDSCQRILYWVPPPAPTPPPVTIGS
ncbi:MAG TPA: C4-type zinc ribbon domain-containing protein [Vicinamibacterales bacterium]|nr:C4-type zinc ribbon domain-containing protein [Vicinamibacterales bacterium]